MKKIALIITLIIIIIMVGCQSTNALTPTTTQISTIEVTPCQTQTSIPQKQTPTLEPRVPNPTPRNSHRSDGGNLRMEKTLSLNDGAIKYINEHECYSLDIPKYWWDYIIVEEFQIPNCVTFYFYGHSMIGQGYKMYDNSSMIELFCISPSDKIDKCIGKKGDTNYSVFYPKVDPIDVIKKEAKNLENDSSSFDNVQDEKAKLDSDIAQLTKMSDDIDGVLSSFRGVTRQEMGWSYICVRNLIDLLWNEYSDYELVIGDTVYTSYDECRSDDDLNLKLRVDEKDLNRLIDEMTLNVLSEKGEIVETKTYKNIFIYLQDDDKMFDELDISAFDAQFLWISGCKSDSDISEITKFKHLRQLYVEECDYLYDISAIGKMTRLKELSLGGTHINSYIKYESIEPLANLKRLEKLNLAYVSLPDILPLANLKDLKILDFTMAYDLEDITHLQNLDKLQKLSLIETKVKDISALVELKGLRVVLLYDLYLNDDWEQYIPQDCKVYE